MVQDKELEIRLQFLEEATEYLNTIESGMLGLASAQADNQRMDAVLRAAHSIKGGAAMMGFQTLSHLAHRLEDFFKVLKTHKPSIDDQLEGLLLTGVSRLRQVIALNHQGIVVDDQWLDTYINPVFEQLHQRLGDPTPADTTHSLAEAPDMVSLIFESEVEEYLQRLESILADPEPQLFAEISTIAQDLSGLGEMLELDAFKSLCESVTQHLEANPEQVEKIARIALQEWRRSQAALLIGQVDTLPFQINLDQGVELPTNSVTNKIESARLEMLAQMLKADIDIPDLHQPQLPIAEYKNDIQTSDTHVHLSVPAELKSVTPSPNLKDTQENTVRVSVKLLDQLNDLFGELTIERNGLNLYLERLRNLVINLSHRVRALRGLDTTQRKSQNKIAIPEAVVPFIPPLPEQTEVDENIVPESAKGNNFDVLGWNSNPHQLPQDVMEDIIRIQEVTDDIDLSLEDTDQTVTELNRTAKQLQTSLTQVRMRPLSDLVGRFPIFLRELCLQYGKNVELKIHGDGTLIDRTILEALNDPLMHLLRNAFDHGIEDPQVRLACGKPQQGVIEISAAHWGTQTLITISDDGGGINLDKIRQQATQLGLDPAGIANSDAELLTLIFEPGFSTAGEVTNLSGRGVGLDVVRTNIREIRGDIKVDTQLGVGTTFTLSVPLTLSVARVLIVESSGMLLAFPSDAIAEMLLLNPAQTSTIAGNEVYSCEGYMMPLIRLGNWLQGSPRKVDSSAIPLMNAPTVLKIATGNELVGIQVDRCWGEQEVAIRQVEGAMSQGESGGIAMPPGFSGCAILGDGRVMPLVNVPELLEWIATTAKQEQDNKPSPTTGYQHSKDTILVVDDSINVRRFLALTLEKAGYRVEQAQNGAEGIEKLLSGLPIKAVICDVDMPVLDGYGLLARAKANPACKHLPIVMLTSRSSDKDRQIAMNLGAIAYFSKPYNEQELVQTLKQLLQN